MNTQIEIIPPRKISQTVSKPPRTVEIIYPATRQRPRLRLNGFAKIAVFAWVVFIVTVTTVIVTTITRESVLLAGGFVVGALATAFAALLVWLLNGPQ